MFIEDFTTEDTEARTYINKYHRLRDDIWDEIKKEFNGALPDIEVSYPIFTQKILEKITDRDLFNIFRSRIGLTLEEKRNIADAKFIVVGEEQRGPKIHQEQLKFLMISEDEEFFAVTIYSDAYKQRYSHENREEFAQWANENLLVQDRAEESIIHKLLEFTRKHSLRVVGYYE